MNEETWTPLDNTAKLFPSIETDRYTSYFRVSVTLKVPVKRGMLQDALDAVLPRFPLFRVHRSAGVFWYTLVEDQTLPSVWPDSKYPCMKFHKKAAIPYLFRIRYFQNRIAAEFSHSLTDGTGAITFLKSLLAEYFSQREVHVQEWAGILRPGTEPDPRESEDAFLGIYQKGLPKPLGKSRAFRIPFRLSHRGVYHITTGLMSLNALKPLAKSYDCTLTEFLCAMLVWSLQETFSSFPHWKQKALARPFRIMIPVNLRNLFPSPTLRNFFTTVPVEIDPRLGHYTLEELAKKVHHFMKVEMDEKLIRQAIARNVAGERNPVVRWIPLFLKNIYLRTVFKNGESQQTMSLSNMGLVELPPGLADQVERFDFIPPPSPFNPVNASMITFGDTVSISFGRQMEDSRVEYYFFTSLRKLGIPIKIETN